MSAVAKILDVTFALGERNRSNEALVESFPEWTAANIFDKTGIRNRSIAAPEQTAGDLACLAAEKLLRRRESVSQQIDLLVLCTQTPDYALPTTACLLQDRLGIPTSCAAFDFNLGCSGYVYGLSIVKSMLENGQASKALLLTGETYSKWMGPKDRSVATIFGDAGTATLIDLASETTERIGPFVYGTDGSGKDRLAVYGSGARRLKDDPGVAALPEDRDPNCLYMDGPEIFSFTIRAVPKAVKALLKKAELTWDDIDHVVFHQANSFMLEHLRKQCQIPKEKFVIDLAEYGNTVSNTIPLALTNLLTSGSLQSEQRIMLVGFGVGYSWSACIINWNTELASGLDDD